MNLPSLVNPIDIDEAKARFQSATPFPSICFDNFLEPEFASEVAAAYPSLEEAKKIGRAFKAVNEIGKVQVTDSSRFPGAVGKLHELLASRPVLDFMSMLSGRPELLADEEMVGGGMHQTGPRGRLDVHVDFNYIKDRQLYRRLNILVFLNRQWEESWGGKLELWDGKVKKCHHTFLPVFNRCIIFETSEISYHGVTAVTCPEGQSRKSFAAYYYTKQDTPEFAPHSTVFRARPDELTKKYVFMPASRVRVAIRNANRNVRSVVKKLIK
ncbi:MAG: 2OG-Fe(II) oxygenase [Planctomycetales bacterium]|nr:2OG-Fe(II) oxygenase [Planctomycetales bacterium]